VIYVYAITEGSGPGVDAEGVDGTAVRMLDHDGLGAAFSVIDGEQPPASTEALLTHERVVESLMRERAVLPARFGTTAGSEDDLRRLIDARRPALQEVLGTVRGCVELAVRVTWDPVGRDGRDRLEAVREQQRIADDARAAVHVPLSELARDSTCTTATTGGGITGAHLVPGEHVGAFAAQVIRLQEELPALDISCTGPWPPYSFTEAGG
jgi:hypothetical protein